MSAEAEGLERWLEKMLPDSQAQWEQTPAARAVLTAVRERMSRAERDCRLEREAAEEAVAEYEGEVERLEQVLARAGPGVAEALAQGRAQSYCQVLADLCISLDTDSSAGPVLESAVADLMVQRAMAKPRLAKAKAEVASLRNAAVGVYEKLSRLTEVLSMAENEEQELEKETNNLLNKTEFNVKKKAEYTKTITRSKRELAKTGGNNEKIQHGAILGLNVELAGLEEETRPLAAQLAAFHSLPPSLELAKVEVEKKAQQLDSLDKELASNIASLKM